MRYGRRIAALALAAAVAAALVYGYMPRPRAVETGRVWRGPLAVTLEEEGRTRVADRFTVSAPVSGYLRRIALEVGDGVREGQALAMVEPSPSEVLDPRRRAEAEARVEAASAALRAKEEAASAARASFEFAQAELERARSLFESGSLSREALDRAETENKRAEAGLRASEFDVQVARHEKEAALTTLKYSAARKGAAQGETVEITSPVEGRVLKIQRKSEGPAAAGEAILEVGDPRSLEVEVDVLSEYAVQISSGTPVVFGRWGGGQPLDGKVRYVEPVGFTKVSALGVEEQRVLVIADITSPPGEWERLGDGFRVEASFVLWSGEAVLQAPSSAVFRRDGGWAAFAVEGGRARLRSVGTGKRSGLAVEITSGLSEGEVVITHPDGSLEDGSRVRPR